MSYLELHTVYGSTPVGKVLETWEENELLLGRIRVGGLSTTVPLLIPDPVPTRGEIYSARLRFPPGLLPTLKGLYYSPIKEGATYMRWYEGFKQLTESEVEGVETLIRLDLAVRGHVLYDSEVKKGIRISALGRSVLWKTKPIHT